MKIYVSHSKNFDFKDELYKPLRNSNLQLEFIFPHEENSDSFNSRGLLKSKECDLVLAEVSYPATGQGIELGWADTFGVPMMCFYKSGTTPATSLNAITDKIIAYNDSIDLINKLASNLGLNIA